MTPNIKGIQLRQEAVERKSGGLEDGGHVLLRCSNCDAILMDIWRTRPHEPDTWKVKATCPFCGDCSFVQEIQGGFHIGGYGEVKEDGSDDFPSTVIEEFTCEGDTFIYIIRKAHPDAKPLKR